MDAEELNCRVLLWDRQRNLVATIDNRELRWCEPRFCFHTISFMPSTMQIPLPFPFETLIPFCLRLRHLDCTEAPLSCDVLHAESSRRSCANKVCACACWASDS
jgi:hypothetical protein